MVTRKEEHIVGKKSKEEVVVEEEIVTEVEEEVVAETEEEVVAGVEEVVTETEEEIITLVNLEDLQENLIKLYALLNIDNEVTVEALAKFPANALEEITHWCRSELSKRN